VSVCDIATYSSSGSTGAGGRALTYRFRVTSEYDTTAILTVIQAMPADGFSSELVVGANDLTLGGIYVITVEVSNFVGSKATATVEATKSTQPVPIVSIDGPSTVYTTAGRALHSSTCLAYACS
jgi:hypothetical protein